jgi:hypothetical protein
MASWAEGWTVLHCTLLAVLKIFLGCGLHKNTTSFYYRNSFTRVSYSQHILDLSQQSPYFLSSLVLVIPIYVSGVVMYQTRLTGVKNFQLYIYNFCPDTELTYVHTYRLILNVRFFSAAENCVHTTGNP